jgi:hypothetical protein
MAEPRRHPLAEKLRGAWLKKSATPGEIKAALEMAQLEVERLWDNRDPAFMSSMRSLGAPQCGKLGCNYRRYPASRFCMYHVTGKDTLAARLRRAEGKQ